MSTATLNRYHLGVKVLCASCGRGAYQSVSNYERYCSRVLGLPPYSHRCDNCDHGVVFADYSAMHNNVAWCETKAMADPEPEPYGQCLSCGAIEARLNRVIGSKDFSGIGESEAYPVGNGCEFCD